MKLLGNRVRWRLLQELARSDRRVQELATLLAQPHNLVSYHLGLLREGHVISERRGALDGRDVYYSLDLERLQLKIERSVATIHPALSAIAVAGSADKNRDAAARHPWSVLFVSLDEADWPGMAAALTNELSYGTLRALSHGVVRAFAAAGERSTMRPRAVEALHELGVIVSSPEVKAIADYWAVPMDYIVTFSESGESSLRSIGGHPEVLHWSAPCFDSKSGAPADDFREYALQLASRVRQLLALAGTGRPLGTAQGKASSPVENF